MRAGSVVNFTDGSEVSLHRLIAVIRKIHEEGSQQEISSSSGAILSVRQDEQGEIVVATTTESEEPPRQIILGNFAILSTDAGARVWAIQKMAEDAGPTAPSFSDVMKSAAEGPLSDVEVVFLLSVASKGVVALHERALKALREHRATLDDLIPEFLAYYEAMCGPAPTDEDADAYIRGALTRHRQTIIERDLQRGLPFVLFGALRDDLSPTRWLDQKSDDELWSAIEAAHPFKDPVSLLSAIDIALGRQHDARFHKLAENGIRSLASEPPMKVGSADMYELMAVFAKLARERINLCEGAMSRPPYWRRLCAWMQAALLLRITEGFGFEPEKIAEWAEQNMPASGRYAIAVDLRLDPMSNAADLSAQSIRREIVGRLLNVTQRHKNNGVDVPALDAVERAKRAIEENGSPLGWALPGPLEGHMRPVGNPVRKLPDDAIEIWKRAISKDPLGREWFKLSYFAQLFDLGEELLAHLRAALMKPSFARSKRSRERAIECITHGTLIAAAQRDKELARVIAAKILSEAGDPISQSESLLVLRGLLLAGGAFEDEQEWVAWLSEQLARLAARVARGDAAVELLAQLQALKIVLPLQFRIHAQAEAIIRAAI